MNFLKQRFAIFVSSCPVLAIARDAFVDQRVMHKRDYRISAHWSAVADAQSYDLIAGDLEQLAMLPDHITLGTVRVLATGLPGTSFTEAGTVLAPTLVHGFFYLIQSRGVQGASGYGTESAPLPSEPASCDGGCSGEVLGIAALDGSRKR